MASICLVSPFMWSNSAVPLLCGQFSHKYPLNRRAMGVFCGPNIWLVFCLKFCNCLCNILQHWTRLYRIKMTRMQCILSFLQYNVVMFRPNGVLDPRHEELATPGPITLVTSNKTSFSLLIWHTPCVFSREKWKLEWFVNHFNFIFAFNSVHG